MPARAAPADAAGTGAKTLLTGMRGSDGESDTG